MVGCQRSFVFNSCLTSESSQFIINFPKERRLSSQNSNSRIFCSLTFPDMEHSDKIDIIPTPDDIRRPKSTETRSKHKYSRSGSKSWFNKSFDHATVPVPVAPKLTIRRQNSVTDFFQHVINKSKCHFQDMFSLKPKDKTKRKIIASSTNFGQDVSPDTCGAVGGLGDISSSGAAVEGETSNMYSSCPSLKQETSWTSPIICFDPDPGSDLSERLLSSQSNRSALSLCSDFEDALKSDYKPVLKTVNSSSVRGVNPSQSPSASPISRRALKIATLPSFDFSATDSTESFQKIPSASFSRPNVTSASSAFLFVGDEPMSRSKRALVKSNSDTFAKMASAPNSLAKASSDGDCFKKSPSSSLATSMTSIGNVMCAITDYLFMGSIEAAYNEPLLCRYGISSLIDMSNTSPSTIPAVKKSDCPCACVSKTHFRSKLNIGVDDIEWENIEQYFQEINTFLNGARRMNRRVLVFSYLGQSRAPAAVIQHLMQHFKMSFDAARSFVGSKRPQVKLNSGFVKALRRLEKRLNLDTIQSESEPSHTTLSKQSPSKRLSFSSTDDINALSVPPVVKGAWLD